MTTEAKAAEKRGYAKGYAAGQRRAEAQRTAAALRRAEDRFWQAAFCAALQGTLASDRPWQFDGKAWSNGNDYARGCAGIANDAVSRAKREGRL